jgi:PAS domain S-box-containing protein
MPTDLEPPHLPAEDALWRTLVEQSPFSVVVYDAEGHPLLANAAFRALWGVGLESAPPGYSVLSDPELERQGVLSLIRRAFAGETVVTTPVRYDISRVSATGEGRSFWTQGHLYPVRDAEGRVTHVVLTHLDLTDRMIAEEALRESELRFRTLAESIPQLAWMAEPDGHIFWYNQRWYDYTGTTPEAMQGWGWKAVHDPAVLPEVVERWTHALRMGERFSMEFPLRGRDGRLRTFLTRVEPVKDEAGRVIRWFGTNTDVEELKEARQRLEVLAEVGAALASSTDVDDALAAMIRVAVPRLAHWCGVYVADESGAVVRHDAAAADPERERVYRLLLERYPPDFSSPAHVVWRPLQTGEVHLTESDAEAVAWYARDAEHARLLRALGLHATLAVPMVVEGRRVGVLALAHVEPGRGFTPEDVALASEIARRAAAAVERARLYDAALAASRAKTGFLATVSHELRTPLNAMLGYTELLLMGIPEPLGPGATVQVERMERASRHLLSIIEEILTFSRIEAGRETVTLEPVDLAELVREVNAIVEPLAAQRALRFHAPGTAPPATLVTDPRKLRQILVNLLGNAVKFTEAGEIAFAVGEEDGTVVFRVRDTGVGIPAEHLERIFDPFWQVDATQTRTAGGTGLGLTVSRELARMLGGELTAESQPGRGSTFTLRLPLG